METIGEFLDRSLAPYLAAAPGHWVRLVFWTARLLDPDGSTGGFTRVQVAATFDGDEIGQSYVEVPVAQSFDAQGLDAVLAGTPDEGWQLLQVEVDRDGTRRIELGDAPLPALEDPEFDELFDAVHHYVDRNRPDVEKLVEQLREAGRLPGPSSAPAGPDPLTLPPSMRPGASSASSASSPISTSRLGRLFGRG